MVSTVRNERIAKSWKVGSITVRQVCSINQCAHSWKSNCTRIIQIKIWYYNRCRIRWSTNRDSGYVTRINETTNNISFSFPRPLMIIWIALFDVPKEFVMLFTFLRYSFLCAGFVFTFCSRQRAYVCRTGFTIRSIKIFVMFNPIEIVFSIIIRKFYFSLGENWRWSWRWYKYNVLLSFKMSTCYTVRWS